MRTTSRVISTGPGTPRVRAFSRHALRSVGDEQVLVFGALPGVGAALVSGAEASALSACDRAATLDEHASRIARRPGAPPPRAVEALLRSLLEKRLLVTEGELLDGIAAAPAPARAPIRVIGIPTRDRPARVVALARALLASAAARGRDIEVVVMDGSSGPETRAALRALPEREKIRYAGPERRAQHAAVLAQAAGVRAEVAAAALGASPAQTGLFAAGANRNALLLDTAGAPSLQVDDDILCAAARSPGFAEGARLSSASDVTDMWFGREMAAAKLESADLVGLHEEILGAAGPDLAALLRRTAGAFADGASAELVLSLLRGGAVASTQPGLSGDSGMTAMTSLLLLDGPARKRLHEPPGYREILTSRRLLRCAPSVVVSDNGFCMTPCIGLDGRGPLAPFPATMRNEDGVFGLVQMACFGGGPAAFLPFAVGHEPSPRRSSDLTSEIDHAGRPGTNDLLCAIVSSLTAGREPEEPPPSLQRLGARLRRWAESSDADVAHSLHVAHGARYARRLLAIHDLLGKYRGAPAAWARDLEALAAAYERSLREGSFTRPHDLPGESGDPTDHLRTAVRAYGELCESWPALVAGACALRAEGARVSEPV